jgi:hypothetical protein
MLPSLIAKPGAKGMSSKKLNNMLVRVGADLRAAMVQLFNVNVGSKIIEQALVMEGMGRASGLNLSDFRVLYFRYNLAKYLSRTELTI